MTTVTMTAAERRRLTDLGIEPGDWEVTPVQPTDLLDDDQTITAYLQQAQASGDPELLALALENASLARAHNRRERQLSLDVKTAFVNVSRVAEQLGYRLLLQPKETLASAS